MTTPKELAAECKRLADNLNGIYLGGPYKNVREHLIATIDQLAAMAEPERSGADDLTEAQKGWIAYADAYCRVNKLPTYSELAARTGEARESEVDRLRAEQVTAVMPLIGPLLDAWENTSRADLRDVSPDLEKQLRAIDNAMEGRTGEARDAQSGFVRLSAQSDHGKPYRAFEHAQEQARAELAPVIAALIARDVCELDPAQPGHGVVSVHVDDLRTAIESRIAATQKPEPTNG